MNQSQEMSSYRESKQPTYFADKLSSLRKKIQTI